MAAHSIDESPTASPSRRKLLLTGGALSLLAVLTGRARLAQADTSEIAGYEAALQPDKATLQRWLQQLHDFGPIRATGTPQCRAFEEWLASQFEQLGFAIERDRYRLTSWECNLEDCSIFVEESGGARRELEVIASPSHRLRWNSSARWIGSKSTASGSRAACRRAKCGCRRPKSHRRSIGY